MSGATSNSIVASSLSIKACILARSVSTSADVVRLNIEPRRRCCPALWPTWLLSLAPAMLLLSLLCMRLPTMDSSLLPPAPELPPLLMDNRRRAPAARCFSPLLGGGVATVSPAPPPPCWRRRPDAARGLVVCSGAAISPRINGLSSDCRACSAPPSIASTATPPMERSVCPRVMPAMAVTEPGSNGRAGKLAGCQQNIHEREFGVVELAERECHRLDRGCSRGAQQLAFPALPPSFPAPTQCHARPPHR